MNDQNSMTILFLSSEIQRLRNALKDLKEGIEYNATDVVWYSGIQTACDRIDEILVVGEGVSATCPDCKHREAYYAQFDLVPKAPSRAALQSSGDRNG